MKLLMAAIILVLGAVVGLAAFISIDPFSSRGRTLATTVIVQPSADNAAATGAGVVSNQAQSQVKATARLGSGEGEGASATGSQAGTGQRGTVRSGLSQSEVLAEIRRQRVRDAQAAAAATGASRPAGVVVKPDGQTNGGIIVSVPQPSAVTTGEPAPGVTVGGLTGITVTVPPEN